MMYEGNIKRSRTFNPLFSINIISFMNLLDESAYFYKFVSVLKFLCITDNSWQGSNNKWNLLSN